MGLEEWEKAPAVGGEAAKVVVVAASSRAAGVGPSQLLESTFPPALPNASALSLAGCSTSGVDSSRWHIMGSLGWRRGHWCREWEYGIYIIDAIGYPVCTPCVDKFILDEDLQDWSRCYWCWKWEYMMHWCWEIPAPLCTTCFLAFRDGKEAPWWARDRLQLVLPHVTLHFGWAGIDFAFTLHFGWAGLSVARPVSSRP